MGITTYDFLGSGFNYAGQIRSPSDVGGGFGTKSDWDLLRGNIQATLGYIDVLATGDSGMQKLDHPLGNREMLDTNTYCVDEHAHTPT